jgi:hypothetical protein
VGKALTAGCAAGLNQLIPIFDSVIFAELPQSFRRFPAFFDTGLFVALSALQFPFNAVDLEFLLQLADCVLKVSFDFNLYHEKITSFSEMACPICVFILIA